MEREGHAELGASEVAAVTLRPGMVLGRYELLVPVAAGGMACVWAARLPVHGGFSKLVAIKTALPHLNNRDFEDMLLDEARIGVGAHHPNVCDLLDVGKDHGVAYLVLEWVNGDSLLRVLRGNPGGPQGPIDYRIAARIVADGCAGLHAAHEMTDPEGRPLGVVHRDVTPHNLLVSLEGVTKIADFGVAKAQGQIHATRTGEVRGKLAYMAPEQIGGGPVDRRADVFAMGCVLYQATIGRSPFRGENDGQIVRAITNGAYTPPARADPNYPPELAAIVQHALAQEPDDRYATAEGLRSALEDWLSSSGSAPVPTAIHVAAVVQERIGAALGDRRKRVQAALDSAPAAETTRPVSVPVSIPVSIQVPSVNALPLPDAAGEARVAARGFKMAIAGLLGLVVAAAVLFTRNSRRVTDPSIELQAGAELVPATISAATRAAAMRPTSSSIEAATAPPSWPPLPARPPEHRAGAAPSTAGRSFPAFAAPDGSPPAHPVRPRPSAVPLYSRD
jgi:serine/threonine-protein kinase